MGSYPLQKTFNILGDEILYFTVSGSSLVLTLYMLHMMAARL